MKRLNFYTIPLIILLCFGLTIGISMLSGYWSTERAKLPRVVDGSYDPYDIRGSYSIGEVMDIFGIPKEDFYAALGLPANMCGTTRLNELEKEILRVDANGNPVHFGVSDVRTFVANYIGWTGPAPTDADHSGDESTTTSVPANAPVETSSTPDGDAPSTEPATAPIEENTTPAPTAENAAPAPATAPTTQTAAPAPAPTKPVAETATPAPTTIPAPAATPESTPVVTAPENTASTDETHTPTPNPQGQGQGQGNPNPSEHTETWTDPRGGTPLSVVYEWGVSREMLEKEFKIDFDEKGLTSDSTLKDLATAAGAQTSDVRNYVSAKMKK